MSSTSYQKIYTFIYSANPVVSPTLWMREPGTDRCPAMVTQLVGDRSRLEAVQCVLWLNRGGVWGKGGRGSASAPWPCPPTLAPSLVPHPEKPMSQEAVCQFERPQLLLWLCFWYLISVVVETG